MYEIDGIEEEERYGTLCHDCLAIFGPEEEGFDMDECIECGSDMVDSVPY